MFEINFKYSDQHKFLKTFKSGNLILIGGRGSGKSYDCSRWILERLLDYEVHNRQNRGVLLRQEENSVKTSILTEVKSRFQEFNEIMIDKLKLNFENKFNIQEHRICSIEKNSNGQEYHLPILFAKGFKGSSNSNRAVLKSLAKIDFTVVEESEDVRDEDQYFTLIDGVREAGFANIMVLNTPPLNHWITKRFFTTKATEYDGWFELVPKQVEGWTVLISNYKDNKFLNPKIIQSYENYGIPGNPFYNLNKYCRDVLGYTSAGLSGLVFKNIQPITLTEYENLNLEPFYGLDFGFTNDPTALIELKKHNNKLYRRELLYEKGLTTAGIDLALQRLEIDKKKRIIADGQEKRLISELQMKGWNITASKKGSGSVRNGLNFMQDLEIFDVDSCENLWLENQNYVWQVDRDGNSSNEPIDAFNHLQDATRYGLESARQAEISQILTKIY